MFLKDFHNTKKAALNSATTDGYKKLKKNKKILLQLLSLVFSDQNEIEILVYYDKRSENQEL